MERYWVVDYNGFTKLEADNLADAINLAHEHENDRWCVWDAQLEDYVEY